MAVIATGFFDGVHLGHRRVVEALVSFARRTGGEAVVVTFAQHPRAVLQQDARSLRLLTSAEEKEAMLYELGVDRVETLPFDRAFARLTASEYIYDVLIGRFDADGLVLGYDNRFGSDRLPPDRIAPIAESLGLEVQVVPPVVIGAVETAAASENRSHPRLRKREGPADAVSGRGHAKRDVFRDSTQPGKAYRLPCRIGARNGVDPEFGGGGIGVEGKDADGDGAHLPVAGGQELPLGAVDADDVALGGRTLHLGDSAAEHPRMETAQRLVAPVFQDDFNHCPAVLRPPRVSWPCGDAGGGVSSASPRLLPPAALPAAPPSEPARAAAAADSAPPASADASPT